jgi:hypothetical protein
LRLAADVLIFQACAPHAGAHSFNDEAKFEFSDGADDYDDGRSSGPAVSSFSRNETYSLIRLSRLERRGSASPNADDRNAAEAIGQAIAKS